MKRILASAALSLVFFSSCHMFGGHGVRGDGNITTQTRSATNFDGIDISGEVDVYITQDPTYKVTVETDSNLQELLEVRVDGGILRIHPRDNYSLDPSREIKVYVSAPLFKRLESSGACVFRSQNQLSSDGELSIGMSGSCDANLDVKVSKVDIDVSGACSIELRGTAKDLEIGGSGSTDVKAFGLVTDNADIDISGAGSVEVFANAKLKASASGAADIRYKGSASVSSDMSGAGSVKKVD